jgi:hypothetical protein
MVVFACVLLETSCVSWDDMRVTLKATPATTKYCSEENNRGGMLKKHCLFHLSNEVENCKEELADRSIIAADAIQTCAEKRFQANLIPEGF